MSVVIEAVLICVVGVLVYGFYRIITIEKDRDLKRREEEIRRKDQEIENLKRERDLSNLK